MIGQSIGGDSGIRRGITALIMKGPDRAVSRCLSNDDSLDGLAPHKIIASVI